MVSGMAKIKYNEMARIKTEKIIGENKAACGVAESVRNSKMGKLRMERWDLSEFNMRCSIMALRSSKKKAKMALKSGRIFILLKNKLNTGSL